MIAAIEMPEHHEFKHEPDDERSCEREHKRGEKAAGQSVEHHREVGAQHVLDPMREVDEVHHPEHEGEAGRDQKQQHPKLKAVENLNDEKRGGHRADLHLPLKGEVGRAAAGRG